MNNKEQMILTKEEERNKLNNIKILMMYFVVYGHLIGRQTDTNLLANNLFKIIYFFHMPVFVMVSGYLYCKSTKKTLKDNINTTLIPFIIFQVIYIVFKYLTNSISNYVDLILEIITPGSVHWYILCMFYWKLIINKVKHNRYTLIISMIIPLITGTISFIGNEFALAKALNYFVYFYIGYMVNEKNAIVKIKRTEIYKMFSTSILVLLLFYNKLNVTQIAVARSYTKMGLSLLEGIINRISVYYISFGISIFIILVISKKRNVLTKLGNKTLSIYLLHNYFIYGLLFTRVYDKFFSGNIGVIISLGISLILIIILGSKFFYYPTKKIISIFEINSKEKIKISTEKVR